MPLIPVVPVLGTCPGETFSCDLNESFTRMLITTFTHSLKSGVNFNIYYQKNG